MNVLLLILNWHENQCFNRAVRKQLIVFMGADEEQISANVCEMGMRQMCVNFSE